MRYLCGICGSRCFFDNEGTFLASAGLFCDQSKNQVAIYVACRTEKSPKVPLLNGKKTVSGTDQNSKKLTVAKSKP
jgi:hypothetical protein